MALLNQIMVKTMVNHGYNKPLVDESKPLSFFLRYFLKAVGDLTFLTEGPLTFLNC